MEPPSVHPHPSPGQQLLKAVNLFSAFPGGQYILRKLIGHRIPYSASIGARIVILAPGYARLVLKDKKSIRNHLNSIHAVALTNLGELTSGIALNAALPVDVRSIVTRITTDYLKKARGTLVAECHCEPPTTVTKEVDYAVEAVIKDQEDNVVAIVKSVWRLGLK